MARVAMTRGLFMLTLTVVLSIPRASSSQDAASIKRGEALYAAQKCQMCHSIGGNGSKVSPLDGVGSRLDAADIRNWITEPIHMAAKTKSTKKPPMPKKWAALPTADIEALVAYLQSLK